VEKEHRGEETSDSADKALKKRGQVGSSEESYQQLRRRRVTDQKGREFKTTELAAGTPDDDKKGEKKKKTLVLLQAYVVEERVGVQEAMTGLNPKRSTSKR